MCYLLTIITCRDPPPKRSEKPTSRRAWSEVRDYTLREIQAREAMKGALEEDVIKELVKLKVSLSVDVGISHAHEVIHFQDLQVKIRNSLKQNVKLAEHVSRMFIFKHVVHRPR